MMVNKQSTQSKQHTSLLQLIPNVTTQRQPLKLIIDPGLGQTQQCGWVLKLIIDPSLGQTQQCGCVKPVI
jgi:hypothetical protein